MVAAGASAGASVAGIAARRTVRRSSSVTGRRSRSPSAFCTTKWAPSSSRPMRVRPVMTPACHASGVAAGRAAAWRDLWVCQGGAVNSHDNHDVSALLAVARTIATETGRLVIDGRLGARVTGTKSAAVDIVTQMDTLAEAHVKQRLADLRPGDGILGEEGSEVESKTGVTWIVDPID